MDAPERIIRVGLGDHGDNDHQDAGVGEGADAERQKLARSPVETPPGRDGQRGWVRFEIERLLQHLTDAA